MHITEDTCRVCLGKQRLNSIFKKNLTEKIKYCASIKLSEGDELPKMICNQCLFYLDVAYIFRTVCEATDARLRKFLKQQTTAPIKTEDYFFIDSPVAHEVVIGEELENEGELSDEEPENSFLLKDVTMDENKEKIGRHTAKKNSARVPKRVPQNHDTTEKNPETKTHQCDQCNKSFPYQSHLTRHMAVHSGIKNYSCHHCGKKFMNRYNLSVHLQKHTGVFPYKCTLCNRGFSSPSLLKRHLKSHSLNPEFQCKFCPKKMLHLSSLRLHEKMHLYRPAYTCDICFKTFSYTSSLKSHKKGHQGIKENTCEVCNKKFTRKTSLRRHMVTHLNKKVGKDFQCDECKQRFINEALLIDHLKQHLSSF